ncbi:hypothetical protein SAMN02745166_03999 [Prosthecobacter debontii]|uniref:Uncharacterized protein n=1 Tax=Prosthecobacter debontii TaxID=48467 RepID=A0A1T4YRE9_9BACT|nr:hypothetical protein SAMN02745166_03999 [Prosthecobacter debontii]
MAKTNGHGNPDWTREETILALALYVQLGERECLQSTPLFKSYQRT